MLRLGFFVLAFGFSSWGLTCENSKSSAESVTPSKAKLSDHVLISAARAAIRFDLARLDKEASVQSSTAKAKSARRSY